MSIPNELSVTEDEGTVEVCATLNFPLFIITVDIAVTLATSDGTGMTTVCEQQIYHFQCVYITFCSYICK